MLVVKRAYEPAEESDGYRVLVDGLWPRGLSKSRARIDSWLKEIAPSAELRRWYGHDPEKWLEFRKRYLKELGSTEARAAIEDLVRRARRSRVTLVFASAAAEISNAAVLEALISRRLKRSASHA
jgi:uncharacterized protein YeaO (DUF488 family)